MNRHYGDSNGDRTINVFDLLSFRRAFQSSVGDADFDASLDFNDDGTINVFDLLPFRQRFGESLDFA